MIQILAMIHDFFSSKRKKWKKSFDDELSKIERERDNLMTTVDKVSHQIEELTEKWKEAEPEVEVLKETLGQLNDDIYRPANLLRQQMDEVVKKIGQTEGIRCLFEVETKDEMTLVTRYEFIPKEMPRPTEQNTAQSFLIVVILVVTVFILVCFRTEFGKALFIGENRIEDPRITNCQNGGMPE